MFQIELNFIYFNQKIKKKKKEILSPKLKRQPTKRMDIMNQKDNLPTYQNGLKWTGLDRIDQNGHNAPNWTKVDRIEPK